MQRQRSWVVMAVLLVLSAGGYAADLDFAESFGFGGDREAALKTLIPGTEDYYYYHALQAQHEKQPEKVKALLEPWIKLYGYTPRVEEIRNRQALLGYDADHAASLEFIRWRMALHFNHEKRILNPETNYPTRLDPKLISREHLDTVARSNQQNLEGYEDPSLERLSQGTLNETERRHLLLRLRRPDLPGLVKLITDDFKAKDSRGFGSLPVHTLLLQEQLEELSKQLPELLANQAFIDTMISRLAPEVSSDWAHEPALRKAYLERLHAFVSTLPPSQSSLKASVLYHRLAHARGEGEYPRELFLDYLRYPRNCHYINPAYINQRHDAYQPVDLAMDYAAVTLLPPIGNDEPLVRDYLSHFFVTEAGLEAFLPYLREDYLKALFAESKILAGVGEMEAWYAMLSPEAYQQLKERVDIDFVPSNKTFFRAGDEVSLALDVKNVDSMIVKIYAINTLNYYRDKKEEVPLSINLDGLVANWEETRTFTEIPQRRIRRTFALPQLKERGVYVVEFIGNGKRSRALIRKGALRYIERSEHAGQGLQILTEENAPVAGGAVWLNGQEYRADAKGLILLPFTERPGNYPLILRDGDFSSLEFFEHQGENYRLAAAVHVDREMLLRQEKARILVRTALLRNGEPISVNRLKEVVLRIKAVDLDGVASTREVSDFVVKDEADSVFELRTPNRLAQLTVTLEGKVDHLISGAPVVVNDERTFTYNGIDTTRLTADFHLQRSDQGYQLYYLGKTGEPQAKRPLTLTFKHREYRFEPNVLLETDAEGRIDLGALDGIDRLTVASVVGHSGSWTLQGDRRVDNSVVHAAAGEVISLPRMTGTKTPVPSELSLLSRQGNGFGRDFFSSLSIGEGFVEVRNLPAGEYDLLFKPEGKNFTLRVVEGVRQLGHITGTRQVLREMNARPLQIAGVELKEESLVIALSNAGPRTRVHLLATRFIPQYDPFAMLALPLGEPSAFLYARGESGYEAGRAISDEYRYILNRRSAASVAGNSLSRPSLLLNPWSLRATDAGEFEGKGGEGFNNKIGRGLRGLISGEGAGGGLSRSRQFPRSPNLDFLRESALLLENLPLSPKGVIEVKRSLLDERGMIFVLAVDEMNTVCRSLALPAAALKPVNLALTRAFNPAEHYAEKKRISVLAPGELLTIEDLSTARMESYDTLGSVYRLFCTLSGDTTLAEFRFITEWPEFSAERKQELYSKYACHELSFFLQRKDPEFFAQVVRPYLENKKDKTFLDEWLLGRPLTPYLEPWSYSRLNAAERVLLAEAIPAQRAAIARELSDRTELLPLDPDHLNQLFLTALKGREMESGGADSLENVKATALEEAEPEEAAIQLVKEESRNGLERGRKVRAQRKLGEAKGAEDAVPSAPASAAPPTPMLAKARNEEDEKKVSTEPLMTEDVLAGAVSEDSAKDAENGTFGVDGRVGWVSPRQLYRKLEKTEEWAENNYYHQPLAAHNPDLVPVTPFWVDYAAHLRDRGSAEGFLSTHLAEAGTTFTGMMLALAVTDLPFKAKEAQVVVEGSRYQLTAGSPTIVYHLEILPAGERGGSPILISQSLFDASDRYRDEGGERTEKVVEGDLKIGHVYGSQVVLTNPGSARQRLEVLMQIPQGALPVENGFVTRSQPITLEPYSTRQFEFYFYLPRTGSFTHFPAHATRNEKLVAAAETRVLKAVDLPEALDPASWEYVSQYADGKELMAYLKRENLRTVNLADLAFRMKEKTVYDEVISLLESRQLYEPTLWSYSVRHDDPARINQFLRHSPAFAEGCGSSLESTLLTIDAVERMTYQHLEYSPLVNPRVFRFGGKREILNKELEAQYRRFLAVLASRPQLRAEDKLAVTYYLLLQDRVSEALPVFVAIKREELKTALQYDYCRAYLAISQEKTEEAVEIAQPYLNHPVPRWRNRFREVAAQVAELQGKATDVVDPEDLAQRHTELARTEAALDLALEDRKLLVHYQNLEAVTVNYYLMDVELLFSTSPFVSDQAGNFAHIRPNQSEVLTLPAGGKSYRHSLPATLSSTNLIVEVVGGGVRRSLSSFSHQLVVQLTEASGQLRVLHAGGNQPLSRVYVKVYAELLQGPVVFYKDGYTDLRGRFDYASLNSDTLTRVKRFSILLMSEKNGSVIKEAMPPLNNDAAPDSEPDEW